MIILSINAGSSSLKFTGFDMPSEKVLISGVFERIGIDGSFYTIKINGEKVNDLEFIVTKENALYQEFTIIRKGKKKYYVIKHK